MMPGQPGNHDAPNSQLLGAVITTDAGRYFLKLVGPEKTIATVMPAWNNMIKSLKKVASMGSKAKEPAANDSGKGGW